MRYAYTYESANQPNSVSAPPTSDVYIAIMGVTGAGKSTFISNCTNSDIKVGHELQACTQNVTEYKCSSFVGRNVYLVDTPGFDDTNRTDKDVLREIASWLGETYKNKVQLSGIIYLHRITDTRMQGSAKHNLFMFQKLCGPKALKNVILATTMWENLADEALGVRREQELINTEEFWGYMKEKGSQVYRHRNTKQSAEKLLSVFVSSSKAPVALKIQEEIIDAHKTLDQTGAGIELDSAMAKEKEKYRRELDQVKAEMKEALAARDNETAEIIRQSQQEIIDRIKSLDRDREGLRVSFDKMYQDRVSKLENELHQQRTANSELQDSMRRMVELIKSEKEARDYDRQDPVRQPATRPHFSSSQRENDDDDSYSMTGNVGGYKRRYGNDRNNENKPSAQVSSIAYLTCLTCYREFQDRDDLFEHLEERERAGKSHARDRYTGRREKLIRY